MGFEVLPFLCQSDQGIGEIRHTYIEKEKGFGIEYKTEITKKRHLEMD